MSSRESGSCGEVLGRPKQQPLHPLARALLSRVGRIEFGRLSLVLPGGEQIFLEGERPGHQAAMRIHRPRAIRRLIWGGRLGLAESYMDGEWTSPDLTALIAWAVENETSLRAATNGLAWTRAWNHLLHRLRPNSRRGSRRNIAAHYDLGNDFYRLWLDPGMTYSSALYADRSQPLAEAQTNKYRHLAQMLDVRPGHLVLEIGCGWGGFAEYLAAHHDCRVVAITLSAEQHAHATARIKGAGLADRVDVRLQDYRDVIGTFDRIASIEMFEAVGEARWPSFFRILRERLAPGGVAAMQVITIADRHFEHYRRGADFIQRYIFPGGMLPSLSAFEAAAKTGDMAMTDVLLFGQDYALTIAEWHNKFRSQWPQIRALGFDDRFRRMWEFYLSYCEGGFRAGSIDVAQLRLVAA